MDDCAFDSKSMAMVTVLLTMSAWNAFLLLCLVKKFRGHLSTLYDAVNAKALVCNCLTHLLITVILFSLRLFLFSLLPLLALYLGLTLRGRNAEPYDVPSNVE